MTTEKQYAVAMALGSYGRDEACSPLSMSPTGYERVGLRSVSDFDEFLDDTIFIVSGCNTPATERTPALDRNGTDTRNRRPEAGISRSLTSRVKNDTQASLVPDDSDFVERSKPIPIENPKPISAPLIEAMSARGDLAVGYFPMHEHKDESERRQIYRPHPFAQEAKTARQRSINEAEACVTSIRQARTSSIISQSAAPTTYAGSRAGTPPAIQIDDADLPEGSRPVARAEEMRRTQTAPIIDSYNPTGIPGSAALLGKYYPTNYQAPDVAGSNAQIPTSASGPSLVLPQTEQARQLQQYKRDMMTQTVQKASEFLRRRMQHTATSKAALDDGTQKSLASGFALLRRYKPSSPRITPLLSPGPVTPMALDEHGEVDYLSARRAVRSR